MKTILCAIDYSDNSIAALRYALALGKALTSRVEVFHVYDQPTVFSSNLRAEEKKLGNLVAQILQKSDGESRVHSSLMEHRSVVEGIVEKIRHVEADLLISGRKGTNKLKELFMGHVARELIQQAPCPFLMIPEGTEFKGLKTLVFATDLEPQDLPAIDHFTSFLRSFQAKTHVIHVLAKQALEEEKKLLAFKECFVKTYTSETTRFTLLRADRVFDTLTHYLDEHKADIVAMTARERRGLSRFLLNRDTVQQMRHYSTIPLWVYNSWSTPIPGIS
ncbi:universal stress protein [Robertkochia flava]|uniref:universal stress protein n=1 Tax=Robertkochia flava TaxID=3447986 RepID=UPI001CCA3C68|nr:universal stress protein [Robertkochia marina]